MKWIKDFWWVAVLWGLFLVACAWGQGAVGFDSVSYVGSLAPALGGLKDSQAQDDDYYSVFNSADRKAVGASWTAGSSYSLHRLKVKVYRRNSGAQTCTAHIYSDNGSGYPSESLGFSGAANVSGWQEGLASAQLEEFSFSTPVSITSGTRYHIVLVGSGVDENNSAGVRAGLNLTGQRISNSADEGSGTWGQLAGSAQFVFETYGK